MVASPWLRSFGGSANKTSPITNTRQQDYRLENGITNGRVAALIDSYARHKSPYAITVVIESLLLHGGDRKGDTGDIKLIPANSTGPAGINSLVYNSVT